MAFTNFVQNTQYTYAWREYEIYWFKFAAASRMEEWAGIYNTYPVEQPQERPNHVN